MKEFAQFAGILGLILIAVHVGNSMGRKGSAVTSARNPVDNSPVNMYHQFNGNGLPSLQKQGGLT